MQPAIQIGNQESPVQAQTNIERQPKLSVVIPISERYDDLREIYLQYAQEISSTGLAHEFIFVLDGPDRGALETLKALKKDYPAIVVIHWS
jgi:hypothetical protein